jgi:indolepyruvate ferredoxin oxidoreductase beta subunit
MVAPTKTGGDAVKCDIILCGVGGQGVLTVGAVIAMAAADDGLEVRQSEVHGMAQRGGAVLSHLRLADAPVAADLIPRGCADLILSMEPLEGLRYLRWRKPDGVLLSAEEPFLNIADYPSRETLRAMLDKVPGARLVPAEALAQQSGNRRAVNMVMVGAASVYLPVSRSIIRDTIARMFASKGDDVVARNLDALELGAASAAAQARSSS